MNKSNLLTLMILTNIILISINTMYQSSIIYYLQTALFGATIYLYGKAMSVQVKILGESKLTKRNGDAGYDVYGYIPNTQGYIEVKPNETVMIPTGIYTVFSEDYVAILKERGSTGVKGIGQRAGVIDASFRGEWKVPITNHNNIPLYIADDEEYLPDNIKKSINSNKAMKYLLTKAIAQAIFIELPNVDFKEISESDLVSKYQSERGEGMLGSSGK